MKGFASNYVDLALSKQCGLIPDVSEVTSDQPWQHENNPRGNEPNQFVNLILVAFISSVAT